MAARYADGHRDEIDGLVLWASYPDGSTDLSDWDGVVASISGSDDGLSTPDDIDASANLLPPDTEFVRIEGGNHAQFGDYGEQDGDNPATISAADQQAQITAATAAVLDEVAAG